MIERNEFQTIYKHKRAIEEEPTGWTQGCLNIFVDGIYRDQMETKKQKLVSMKRKKE